MTAEEIRTQINALSSNIISKKAELASTDYEVIKVAEGASASISEELKTNRQTAREEINRDEEKIKELQALTPDDTAVTPPPFIQTEDDTDAAASETN
jgi:septal ring factor EnvC (AmiA/AmiB activator)